MIEFNTDEYLNFRRKTIGMVFQAFYLIPSLTVVRNVTLPQVFLNTDKAARRAKAMDLLEYFGVKAQAYKLPTELSGGQMQRIAISRSLVNDPEVIMADEPVGNLDSKSSEDVMKILQKLNEEKKKTVILVTHDPSFLSIAHRVFYLKDGHVVDVKVNKVVKALEFKQPAKIERDISRELDLLINTFSSLTPDQIGNLLIPFKAKQIVSEALIGLTSEDLRKIEQKVETMLMTGVYQDDSTRELLDKPTEEGGLGLDTRTAQKLSDKVTDMVREIKLLEEEDKRIKDHVSPDSSSEIMQVRHYLLEIFETHLKTFAALEVFDKAIGERLTTAIDRKEFVIRLYTPLSKGGCGIHKRTSKKIGKRLELLILGKYK
jgi:ABC-type lipoprotein export system ATPase subunit